MASDRDRSKEIDDLLKTVEPRFRNAFQEGLRAVRAEISLAEIERALNRGDLAAAANLINEVIVAGAFLTFSAEMQAAVQAGGDIAARWARADKLVFRLNVTESNTARFISSHQANFIREVTAETQRMIGEVVRSGVIEGKNPKVTARIIKDSIGLTAKQTQIVDNYEKLLRERKRDALNRVLRDKRSDRSVIAAINNQTDLPEKQITSMVSRYRDRLIRHRANTIARTESIRLVSRGQHEFWEQAIREGRVQRESLRRKWIPTFDGRTREAHRMIPSLNKDGVGFDEPFRTPLGPLMYPGDTSSAGSSAGNVINCFHPDTLIFNSGLNFSISRNYVGDMINITLTNGISLTVTPNHPVLTQRGWVKAAFLNKFDNLINCDISDISDRSHPDINNIYATAASVHDFNKIPSRIMNSTGARVDLHGDIVSDKDIEIISLPSLFRFARKSPAFKLINEIKLKHTDFPRGLFLCNSILSGRFRTSIQNRFCFVSFFSKFFSFVWGQFLHAYLILLASRSWLNSHIFKALINKISATINFLRDFFARISLLVKNFYLRMKRLSFFKVDILHRFFPENNGFRALSNWYREVIKAANNHIITNSKSFSNISNSVSAFIKRLNIFKKGNSFFSPVAISSIDRFHYNGPVYNFETDNGLIIANNIVTHNCRCSVFTRIKT